jgi:hypothetical protein
MVEYERGTKWMNEVTTINRNNGNDNNNNNNNNTSTRRQQKYYRNRQIRAQKHLQRARNSLQSTIPSAETFKWKKKAANRMHHG